MSSFSITAPVGFDGTPFIEEVNKPFYKVIDGLHITDDYLLDEEVDEDDDTELDVFLAHPDFYEHQHSLSNSDTVLQLSE